MAGIFTGGYPISRSAPKCSATGRDFAPGEPIVAALVESPGSDELQRQDFAVDAWTQGARPAGRLFASWRATHQPAESKRKLLLGDDELLDLFEQLAEAVEPRQIAFRYVLALLLVRRRILIYEGAADLSSGPVIRVRIKRPGGAAANVDEPILDVADPKLDDQTIAGVIEQLGEVVGA